ncbi:MAG: hypothetical protein ABJE47_24825 [bacterium]
MPRFWQFFETARGLTNDAAVAEFRRLVICPDSLVYESLSGPPDDKALTRYLKRVVGDTGTMRLIHSRIQRDFAEQHARFDSVFTDANWDGIQIYFAPWFYNTNAGGGRMRNGPNVLMFGVDALVADYTANRAPALLFQHELFHLYHGAVGRAIAASDASSTSPPITSNTPPPTYNGTPLFWSVWREGLATYASLELNPSASLADASLSPTLVGNTSGRLREISADIRQHLDSTSRAIREEYLSGAPQRKNAVPRSGYYVGLLVARRLAEHHTLPELTRLRFADMRMTMDSVLHEFEQGNYPTAGRH